MSRQPAAAPSRAASDRLTASQGVAAPSVHRASERRSHARTGFRAVARVLGPWLTVAAMLAAVVVGVAWIGGGK